MGKKLKKYLKHTGIFVFGLLVGILAIILILEVLERDTRSAAALMAISELEEVSSDIYKTGEYQSSIRILNHLVSKLKLYEKNLDGNSETFITDRGLAHGRLYILYKRRGKVELAEMEYKNAKNIIGKKYNIKSKDDLFRIVQSFDDIGK